MLSRYILNVVFSSICSFYLCSFLVFSLRKIFRILNPRLLYFLYTLPFYKTTWDLLFSNHHLWAHLHNAQILNAPLGSRSLNTFFLFNGLPKCGISLSLHNHYLFSIGDYLVESIGTGFLFPLACLFVSLTLVLLLKKGFNLYRENQTYKQILKTSSIYSIDGKTIFVTEAFLPSAVVIGLKNPKILFPKKLLDTLSKEEALSIISHEMAHIKWHDNYTNLFLILTNTLFWFIPFKNRLLKKIFFYRELSCDQKALQNPEATASALLKTLSFQNSKTPYLALPFSSEKSSDVFLRIQAILKNPFSSLSGLKKLSYISLFLGSLIFIIISQFFPF